MLGIKKIARSFLLTIALCQLFLGQAQTALAQGNEPPIPPAPTGGNVVLDTLDWLTLDQEAKINAINKKLDAEGIAQIAVVTLNDCGADKKTFRNHLFNAWGIGHANDNDGLLIMVCWYDGDQTQRSVEQEVGYGLEKVLPSNLTDEIAKDYFVTAFHENHAGDGLIAMVERYDGLLREKLAPQSNTSTNQHPNVPLQPSTFVFLGVLGFIILSIVAILLLRIRALDSTHLSRRGEMREEREKRRLVLIIVILITLGVVIFLAVVIHFAIAIIVGILATVFIATIFSWSYRGRVKGDRDPDEDTSWFASGHSKSGSGSNSSGDGGFGGGSSGGAGSSTGF